MPPYVPHINRARVSIIDKVELVNKKIKNMRKFFSKREKDTKTVLRYIDRDGLKVYSDENSVNGGKELLV